MELKRQRNSERKESRSLPEPGNLSVPTSDGSRSTHELPSEPEEVRDGEGVVIGTKKGDIPTLEDLRTPSRTTGVRSQGTNDHTDVLMSYVPDQDDVTIVPNDSTEGTISTYPVVVPIRIRQPVPGLPTLLGWTS